MGFNIRKAFHTNAQAEQEGRKLVLVPKTDTTPESFLVIARKGNPLYKAYLSKLLQENQAMLQIKSPESEKLAESIFRKAAANHLLLNWGGIDWEDKADVPYSVEMAETMLAEKDFYALVDKYADDMSNYRDEEVAAEGKA